MAENGPVRGTMVIRPYGYAIWERVQAAVDRRIKRAGAQNVYFPLFVPESYLQREAEHVEGFSPELAVVTHAGGEALAEPIVVRPTSETVFGEYMAKWIQSYRDLPMLLNQWANVVRWELRPRLFLRSTEFLWQEGHCAHASYEDAAAYARRIHLEVYHDFIQYELAIPTYVGIKPKSERFAGAINSLSLEGMMRDGKALQMATSHELGQNFARAFDMVFQSEGGQSELCWTTSWGLSTRTIGGLIMVHGDDQGLVIPPRLAPTQVVVMPVRDDEEVVAACRKINSELVDLDIRSQVDNGRGSFGRRATDWEVKGVPVRIEVGPRDLANGEVTVVRRDTSEKITVKVEAAVEVAEKLLLAMQESLFSAAEARLKANTFDVSSIDEAIVAAQKGFARLDWSLIDDAAEARMKGEAITVRCLQRRDGSIPLNDQEDDLIAIVAKSY
jgi:prolyl-tRNA synthetase